MFSIQKLPAQAKSNYSELSLYNQTLTPEYIQAYQKALDAYTKNPRVDSDIVSKNKEVEKVKKLSQNFNKSLKGDSANFASVFILALQLELALDDIDEEQYPDKRADYARLGEVYYLFNDFEKSIVILRKALTKTPPRTFTDRANLDARKMIGLCYANLNQMGPSDYYFRSILESEDMVLDRPVYNAYALSLLGYNAMMRGKYEKALVLGSTVLPFFRNYTDPGHLADMYYSLSKSYYNLGDIVQSGLAVDSILVYANKDNYQPSKRFKQAFSALIRYNAAVGNATLTKAYNDSLINIYRQDNRLHASQYIAHARQVLSEQHASEVQKKVTACHRNMIVGIVIAFLVMLFAGYTFFQYRRLRTAYRTLAQKSRQWAEQIQENYELINKLAENSSPEEVSIMQQVHDYVILEKNYLDAELSLDKLSKELNINRSYLSSAINHVMGKNFSAYINEYRISEAFKILNSEEQQMPIKDLIIACGFNNKNSFYNYFKKVTGITPSEYRNNFEKDT